jgi:PAS domain S-box-containing protein
MSKKWRLLRLIREGLILIIVVALTSGLFAQSSDESKAPTTHLPIEQDTSQVPLWVFISLTAVQLVVICCLIAFIKKRKKSKEDPNPGEDQVLRDVINALPIRLFWKDKNSIFIGCNQLMADDALKNSPDDIIGKSDADMLWGEQAPLYIKDDKEVMRTGLSKINYEEPHSNTDGSTRWVNTSKAPLRNPQGEVYGVMGAYEDITIRKNFEEELKLSEEKLRMITTNIPGVVYQFYANSEGKWGMHYVSERAKKIFGIPTDPETFIDRFTECVHEDDRAAFIESIEDVVSRLAPWHFEGRFIRPDGDMVYFRGDAIPSQHKKELVFNGILYDLTEQKNIKEQLHHSQKMDAVGKLAGGVEHDFNNMLGGIVMAAEVLEAYLSEDPEAAQFQQIIIDSAHHAADLTKQLLAFSRKQPASPKNIDLHKILHDVSSILKNTVDKRIIVEESFKAESSVIKGDASYLQSAMLNLGINASHAMPDGGTISISTKDIELDEAYCNKSIFEIVPGTYLEFTVTDTGVGIDPKNLSRIFEPFFTTKAQGKGTGLGLAAVYGTVQQHKGAITVSSKIDQGTTFQVLLPLTFEKEYLKEKIPECHKGSGHILIVDDEEILRVTSQALLTNLGYKVTLAENGKHALEIFEKNPDSFDLVLLDMIMPEMNGKDCFKAMRKIRPNLLVILASGFTQENDLKEMESQGLNGFLNKPFRRANLSQIVSDVLKVK